jgi:hypothetical protein
MVEQLLDRGEQLLQTHGFGEIGSRAPKIGMLSVDVLFGYRVIAGACAASDP